MKLLATAALAAGFVLAAEITPAHAQKEKDTLRIAQTSAIALLDYWIDPRPEVQFNAEAAFDNLISYDDNKHAFVGTLVKSWKRVSPTVLEFQLRDDVTWSDGEKFDADDVVYTFNWVLDKDTKLRFKEAYTWIDKVEKTGPYTVRFITKEAIPWGLARLSTQTYILPEHVHAKLADKNDFGHQPVGTGPYRYIQIDQNKGLVAVKRDTYPQANSAKPAPTIGRLTVTMLPDPGTTTSMLMADQIDIAKDLVSDQAENLASTKKFELTLRNSQGAQYLLMDARGRSGVKALTDPKVRQAIAKSIDTKPYYTVVLGKEFADTPQPGAICSPRQVGCDYSVPQEKYDPKGAKDLLAQTEYANGFDVTIIAFEGQSTQIAQILAGQLHAIGIRASIKTQNFASYRNSQRDGKLELLVGAYGGGGLPDVAQTLNFFFSDDAKNYHGRPDLIDLAGRVNTEMDPAKREAYSKKLLDEVTAMHYLVPLTDSSDIIVHRREVAVNKGSAAIGYGYVMSDVSWK